ncbi:MAG: hypothetical protein WAT58_12760 [Candidatus Dormiibacterota bacterium]
MSIVVTLLAFAARGWTAFLNVFSTRSAVEFERFKLTQLPYRPDPRITMEPAPAIFNVALLHEDAVSTDPADCEERFTSLVRDGRFEDAWELLSPDCQVSWGEKAHFIEEMRLRQAANIVDSTVREVRILATWTDELSSKTYREVAELLVDYRLQHNAREVVVQKSVHVVNIRGGWKSLCYPT